MGGKQSGGGNALASIVAFEYEVPVESVKILSETGQRKLRARTLECSASKGIRPG